MNSSNDSWIELQQIADLVQKLMPDGQVVTVTSNPRPEDEDELADAPMQIPDIPPEWELAQPDSKPEEPIGFDGVRLSTW